MTIVRQLFRFPIKGFNGQELSSAEVLQNAGIEHDRRFAIAINHEIDGSQWLSSRSFLINSINDNLLKYALSFDGNTISLTSSDGLSKQIQLNDEGTLDGFNKQLTEFLSSVVETDATPQLVERHKDGGPAAYWDYSDSQISIINLETVRELSREFGEELDPKRFRANIVVDGLPAWSEFGLAGSRFSVGSSEIEFTRPARRCPAISIDPATGVRGQEIHKLLSQNYGHGYFGVYGRVVKSGQISIDDSVSKIADSETKYQDAVTDGARHYAPWPKLADIRMPYAGSPNIFELSSATPWPLIDREPKGKMQLHIGPNQFAKVDILPATDDSVQTAMMVRADPNILSNIKEGKVVATGPYGR